MEVARKTPAATPAHLPLSELMAAVPGPLASVIVHTLAWRDVARLLAQADRRTLAAVHHGWRQLQIVAAVHAGTRAGEAPTVEASEPSVWLTTTQAAERAGVDSRTVRNWCADGRVHAEQDHPGAAYKVDADSLADLLDARDHSGASEPRKADG